MELTYCTDFWSSVKPPSRRSGCCWKSKQIWHRTPQLQLSAVFRRPVESTWRKSPDCGLLSLHFLLSGFPTISCWLSHVPINPCVLGLFPSLVWITLPVPLLMTRGPRHIFSPSLDNKWLCSHIVEQSELKQWTVHTSDQPVHTCWLWTGPKHVTFVGPLSARLLG